MWSGGGSGGLSKRHTGRFCTKQVCFEAMRTFGSEAENVPNKLVLEESADIGIEANEIVSNTG